MAAGTFPAPLRPHGHASQMIFAHTLMLRFPESQDSKFKIFRQLHSFWPGAGPALCFAAIVLMY